MSILYNGPIEVGVRVLLLLHEAFPSGYDIADLTMLDYIMVHSGDFMGGPPSVYAPSPLRTGEVALRRSTISKALHLLGSRELIFEYCSDGGIEYKVSDNATIMVDALESPLAIELRSVARWTIEQFQSRSRSEFQDAFQTGLDRWRHEFIPLDLEDDDLA